MEHNSSALPTIPDTASTWIGCVANKTVAKKLVRQSSFENNCFSKTNIRQDAIQCKIKLIVFMYVALRPNILNS